MRRQPLRCGPETSLEQAQQLMLRAHVNTLFVTEPDARLLGLIDLLGLLSAAEAPANAGPEPEWNQRVRGKPA